MSEKDKADLEFGAKIGVDFVFASFIRKASQVQWWNLQWDNGPISREPGAAWARTQDRRSAAPVY